MKRVRYFIRSYLIDFLAAISAIILAGVTFIYSNNLELSFFLSTVIVLFFLLLIIYIRSRDKDFYFIPLQDRKDKDDWIGRGRFEYSRVHNSFQLTQAGHGYIYSKCLNWSDYKLEFEFKIRNYCIGALIRAINLTNCVMLQITELGVRAHISINGSWLVWEPDQTGLKFQNLLSTNNWYKCQLICDKEAINIRIWLHEDKIFDKDWRLPEGTYEFVFKKNSRDRNPVRIPFPVNLEYGSAGFRNSADEKAFVKNVLIEKI